MSVGELLGSLGLIGVLVCGVTVVKWRDGHLMNTDRMAHPWWLGLYVSIIVFAVGVVMGYDTGDFFGLSG